MPRTIKSKKKIELDTILNSDTTKPEIKQAELVFKRVEKKYILTEEQYEKFIEAIKPYMQLDEYGLHTICNIYYDTEAFDLVSRSIDKPVYKEKLRLRSYGVPSEDTMSFIEIKKKYKGVVYKRREGFTFSEAQNFLLNGVKPDKESQIINEIDYFLKFYKPEPKLYLAYDREAFFGKENKEVRMTIDRRIRYRETDLDMTEGDFGNLLFKDNVMLLEIKVPDAMPLWLCNILTELKIYSVSFSKYGTIYKKLHAKEQVRKEYKNIIKNRKVKKDL